MRNHASLLKASALDPLCLGSEADAVRVRITYRINLGVEIVLHDHLQGPLLRQFACLECTCSPRASRSCGSFPS